jgi:ketosteroid isomerase-like protein
MEIARAWRDYLSLWEDFRLAADEFRELDERVLVLGHRTGRAKASGVDLAQMHNRTATLFEIHDGRVTRLAVYWDRERALADLGLAPEGELWTGTSNLDLVRSIYAAWERGDFSHADWAHPEIEYMEVEGPAAGSWTGLVGMAEAMRGWLSAWEECRVEADEYRELDDECVLVLAHWGGRGKTSGLDLGQMSTKVPSLFHVCDGKVTTLISQCDPDRALGDLGLKE